MAFPRCCKILVVLPMVIVVAVGTAIAFDRPWLTIGPCRAMGTECDATFQVRKYLPALPPMDCVHGFHHESLYYCAAGLWLHYEREDFLGPSHIIGPDSSSCDRILNSSDPKSFRYPGNPANQLAPSLTLYEHPDFHGDEYKLYHSMDNFRFPFDSLVLIETHARLYTQPGFAGLSVCLAPKGDGLTRMTYGSSTNVGHDYGLDAGSGVVRSIEFVDTCE